MNRLEQLGFECVAAEWLERDRGVGRLLRQLVVAAPAVVRFDALRVSYRGAPSSGRVMTREGLRVQMCRLREGLADVGYPDAIMCVPREGYGMARPVAEAITSAVLERAE